MNATMNDQQLRDLQKATWTTSINLAGLIHDWNEILNDTETDKTFTHETLYRLAKDMSDLANDLKARVLANIPEEENGKKD
jgi:hypothetical protein